MDFRVTDLLILNRQDVETHLTMSLCIDAVDTAMRALSADKVISPLRSFAPIGEDRGVLALMPAATTNPPYFGVKTLSLLPANPSQGRPAIQGYVALFDQETGAPAALIDGVSVTAIRTAAASGLATRELARADVKSHGILGTGVQSYTHAKAILEARPDLERTLVWGRSQDKAETVARALSSELDRQVEAASLDEAVACDVISAVTATAEPLIEKPSIKPGAHINLVGSHTPKKREASSETIAAGRLYVDLKSSALKEAGDILIPMNEGLISEGHIVGEIGEVLLGGAPGRADASDITIYKSLGNAAQDLFAAAALLDAARKSDAGTRVEF